LCAGGTASRERGLGTPPFLSLSHPPGKIHPHRNQRGRHAGARNEKDEDAELLRDEEDASGGGHRLTVQPSIITGGTLREYQMQGMNWLIHLYDNGINGILADEMVRALMVRHARTHQLNRTHARARIHQHTRFRDISTQAHMRT
jgi:hypothetical protein